VPESFSSPAVAADLSKPGLPAPTAAAPLAPSRRVSRRSTLVRYAVVLLAVALASALRYSLHAELGLRAIYIFYFLAIAVSAMYGGLGPGFLALTISGLVAVYLFVPPQFHLALPASGDQIGFAAFVATGLVILGVIASERAGRARQEASDARYREMVETAQDLIWAFDLDGRVGYINQHACRAIFGVDAAEMIGRPWADFVAPAERAGLEQALAGVLAGGTMLHVPVTAIRKDGAPLDLLVNAMPQRVNGRITGVTGTSVDVTAQRSRERDLQLFRALMDRSSDGILILEARTRQILDVNQTICRWLDYTRDELLTCALKDLVIPHPTMTWEELGAESYRLGHSGDPTAPPLVLQVEYRRRDGVALPREAALGYVMVQGREYAVVVLRDVSERRRLEQQLHQSLKMEGVGRLAGGIAHDFNNMLTAIGGYTEIALDTIGPDHPAVADLAEVLASAGRAAALTQQLLAFARKQVIRPRLISLNDLVRRTDGLLGRVLGDDIRITARLSEDLWPVHADPGQFEQILVNLAVNARDAMAGGGTLAFGTANVTLDADWARVHPEVVPGDYVRLTIADTGIGMTKAVQEHVFEPFFTTKDAGKGTGLGLATCHGIVKQSGGHIWLRSAPGEGTTFTIHLPRASGEVAAVVPPATAFPPLAEGSETILLVEDDPLVRQFAATALQRTGYRVIEAATGEEAIDLAEKMGDPVHLLLSDVIMPGMNGPEVARRVLAVHPEARVLFASGYAGDPLGYHGPALEGLAFLQKPYSLATVTARVREALDAPPGA
jgi:two-component system cell cycle sensor histidine kinase/response regulator CckA